MCTAFEFSPYNKSVSSISIITTLAQAHETTPAGPETPFLLLRPNLINIPKTDQVTKHCFQGSFLSS